jgi:branched-chain amino acid transport system permease protein
VDLSILLQQLFNGVSLGGVYALEAVGFGLIFNILKFSNFSHSGLVAICAYLGYFLARHVYANFIVTLILTTVAGGFIGVLIEKLIFRPILSSWSIRSPPPCSSSSSSPPPSETTTFPTPNS